MNKKLPKVYVKKQENKILNNKETFYSKNEEINLNSLESSTEITNELIIRKKISDIFSSPKFIYKTKVLIKTLDDEKEETIIAKTNNSLLTIENKIIPICIIKDIKPV
ncbi:MAG: hypothetical protein IJB82_04810 [Bacilli bacterium]|nr:hypothetical protein [Bacilli bacterium]